MEDRKCDFVACRNNRRDNKWAIRWTCPKTGKDRRKVSPYPIEGPYAPYELKSFRDTLIEDVVKGNIEHTDYDDEEVWIYGLKCPVTGLVKIGSAKDLGGRFEAIQANCPTNLEVVMSFKDVRSKENQIHKHLKHKRVRHEWFSINENDIVDTKQRFSK